MFLWIYSWKLHISLKNYFYLNSFMIKLQECNFRYNLSFLFDLVHDFLVLLFYLQSNVTLYIKIVVLCYNLQKFGLKLYIMLVLFIDIWLLNLVLISLSVMTNVYIYYLYGLKESLNLFHFYYFPALCHLYHFNSKLTDKSRF